MSRQGRRRRSFFWIVLATGLVVVLVVGTWQLFNVFQVNDFDIQDTIQDSPLGRVAGIVTDWTGPAVTYNGTDSGSGGMEDEGTGSGPGGSEDEESGPEDSNGEGSGPEGSDGGDSGPGPGGGSPPEKIVTVRSGNLIFVNTNIDYGVVFPGEILTDYFTVHLVGTGSVTYTVNMTENMTGGYSDMRPYLLIVRDPAEIDIEPDSTANGTDWIQFPLDYIATGNLTYPSDNSDKWLVKLYVPDVTGIYQADIEIVPTDNTTVTKD